MNGNRQNAAAALRDSPPAAPRASGVQVIARVGAILRALRDHPGGLSLGELARIVGMSRSTVQRLVEALCAENLLIAVSARRGVRLGPALLALAAAARFEIVELARPTLEALARECGETVDLSVMDRDKMVFVDQVMGTHRLRAASTVGSAFPLHASANGKACLAVLPPADLEVILRGLTLTAHTPQTLTTQRELRADLAAVRKCGFALDLEEHSSGICAVGMALVLPDGAAAAISIPVPTQRFGQVKPQLVALLQAHCRQLQLKLRPAVAPPTAHRPHRPRTP